MGAGVEQNYLHPINGSGIRFSCIEDGAWMVTNQNKTSSFILDLKFITTLNLNLILIIYFYLGCVDL